MRKVDVEDLKHDETGGRGGTGLGVTGFRHDDDDAGGYWVMDDGF